MRPFSRRAQASVPGLHRALGHLSVDLASFAWGVALMVAMPAAVSAQQSATVAVMDFTAFSVSLQDATALGKGLAGMLTTELGSRPGLRVVERQQIRSILDEQRLALSARTEEGLALEIGRLLGAEYLITGNLALARETARMDVRVLRVSTAEVVATHKRSGHPDDLFEVVIALADDFAGDLQVRTASTTPPPRRAALPAAALMAYSRGLDYEDRGERSAATAMYAEALRLHPGYPEAMAALSRLNDTPSQ